MRSDIHPFTIAKEAFPSEESVYTVFYLRIRDLQEKWKKPINNWKIIQQQLIQLFAERYTKYLNL